jgi:hypothetical protein
MKKGHYIDVKDFFVSLGVLFTNILSTSSFLMSMCKMMCICKIKMCGINVCLHCLESRIDLFLFNFFERMNTIKYFCSDSYVYFYSKYQITNHDNFSTPFVIVWLWTCSVIFGRKIKEFVNTKHF